jgi:hypothetical protein
MFGNTKGWLMSAAIAALVALLIVYAGQPPQMTPSTHQFDKFIEKSELSVNPRSLNVKLGTNDCDAGDLYRKVINDYRQNKFHYKNHYEDAKDAIEQLEKNPPQSVQWIVDAADCNRATLFRRHPEELVNYTNSVDALEALDTVGHWLGRLAALDIAHKKYDAAQPYLRGEFLLGMYLYEERLRWREYTVGTGLMDEAAAGMARIAGENKDTERADQLARLSQAIADYQKSVTPMWAAISGIGNLGPDGNLLPLRYTGDMFDFATNPKTDPMWRTEAILKLGRMRYMANESVGDQRGANRITAKMAADAKSGKSDMTPGVQTAAEKAAGLTSEGFNSIGGGS